MFFGIILANLRDIVRFSVVVETLDVLRHHLSELARYREPFGGSGDVRYASTSS
jgi:hypothetical protein